MLNTKRLEFAVGTSYILAHGKLSKFDENTITDDLEWSTLAGTAESNVVIVKHVIDLPEPRVLRSYAVVIWYGGLHG